MRYLRNPEITVQRMADGSAVASDAATGLARPLTADAVAIWDAQATWTTSELGTWLTARGEAPEAAGKLARALLEQLEAARILVPDGDAGQRASLEDPFVAHYRLWQSDWKVTIADPEVAGYVDRLCHQFASAAAEGSIEIEVPRGQEEWWEIRQDGEVVETCQTAVKTARRVEFRMVRRAARSNEGFVHWHGSALTYHGRTVLIPGRSGIGKSTLSLAMALSGFEMLGDDVVFQDAASGAIHPFHRALIVRDGTIPLLEAAGYQRDPALELRYYLQVEALPSWRTTPSPPLSHVLLVDWDEEGPVEIAPITLAEAATQLRRFSHNIKRHPGEGWPLLAQILASTRVYRLLRSQDLPAAVDAIRDLLDGDPLPASG